MSASFSTEGSSISPKYEQFSIIDVPYKHVNGVPIETSILLPKDLKPGPHPIVIRFHGGGFGTGTRLFPDWYAPWILSLSLSEDISAISLSPSYRLLSPSTTGREILADCKDFFSWLFEEGNLASHLPEEISPDLSGVLVTGESAGGWMAVQAGFLFGGKSGIKAVIAQYPMIDLESEHFTVDKEGKEIGGDPPWPRVEEGVVRGYLEAGKGGEDEVVVGRTPPEGADLTMGMIQRGLYGEFFGKGKELMPLRVIEGVEDYPPLWILHGAEDTVVPVEGTRKFVAKFKEKFSAEKLHVSIVDGEEHAFDCHDAKDATPATLDTHWVKPGVEFIKQYWP